MSNLLLQIKKERINQRLLELQELDNYSLQEGEGRSVIVSKRAVHASHTPASNSTMPVDKFELDLQDTTKYLGVK